MKKTLKEILAMEVADLGVEEKALLQESISQLTDEQKEKFAEVLEEGLDVNAVKELVTATMQEGIKNLEGKVNDMADGIVAKFFKGAGEQRRRAAAGDKIEGADDAKGQDKVRAFMKALVSGDKVAAKALTDSTSGSSPDDAQAGLTIPVELRNEVLRIAEKQFGLARREMLYLPFSGPGNSRVIPSLGTSVSVWWTGEGAKKDSTQPTFNVVTQTLKKLAAIVPFTEEILEDSAINITQLLAALFAEAVAKEEDIQFFAGTGSPWTGVLNNSNVNGVDQATGDVTQLTADDLLDMIDATPTGALAGSKFYMSRSVFSIVRKLKTEQGAYIYQQPSASTPAQIWDYPFELSDAFPAAGDVDTGDPYILFGNLKQGAVFGDKQQLRVKLLDQATITDTDGTTQINLAEQDMLALRIEERVGYVVALPKALTVLSASATVTS